MIIIESKRKRLESIRKKYPNAIIVDVTSKSDSSFQKLSPFYPWGDIPIPFTPNHYASCVESVWQGLKVFENQDIDYKTFNNKTMKNIKRCSKKYGKIIGHRRGLFGHELLDYKTARQKIYIPTYRWMMENKAFDIIQKLRAVSISNCIVLLDYNTNDKVDNLSKPISHAYLVKAYIEGLPPFANIL